MTLTKSQAEHFRNIEEALQERKPVLLTGKSNGKTTLVHQALEVLGQRDERTGGYSSTPKHRDNRTIDYFPRIYFPRSDKLDLFTMMRQICGLAGLEHKNGAANTIKAFEQLMTQAADQHRIICLAIDNAESLGPKAYSILKTLNEYRDVKHRRNIGVGLLIAGDVAEMYKRNKMPVSFLLRCQEVAVGKIGAAEIEELIEILYPGRLRFFAKDAMRSLVKCGTTLAAKSVIDRCVKEQRRYDLSEIGGEMVEEYQLALAA